MQNHTNHRPVYEWSLVILLAMMWGFVGLNRAGIGYLLPAIVPEFHLEFWMAGLLVSGTSIAWAISAWLSGSISDRIGRKPVLVVGMYAASAVAALFGLSWNFLSMFIFRDLLGIGDGVGFTTGQATIAERTNPKRRALFQGIFTGGYSVLGVGLGAWIVTHLTTEFGWRWVFPVIGLLGAIITTALVFMLPNDLSSSPKEDRLVVGAFWKDMKELAHTPGWPAVTICGGLGLAWLGLNIAFSSLFLVQVRGFSLDDVGTIVAISTIVGFVGPLVLPSLSDVVGRRPIAALAAVGAGVGYILFPLVPLPGPALVALLTFAGFCAGGLAPLTLATFYSELVPHRKGAAIGIGNFFTAILGASLAPIYGGFLADHFGLVAPLLLAGIFQLAIAPIILTVPETAPLVLARAQAAHATHAVSA
ncbi:MAG: MFS transporter [Chloroflexi bacterium]|nr:MFS transporter [Chloroflexota bacterium]